MSWMRRSAGVAVLVGLALVCGRTGSAFQRGQPAPAPTPDYSSRSPSSTGPRSSFDEQMVREIEDKRGKALNNERQRLMVRDANQLVQVAAELELGETSGMTREDQVRRAELIEKLAKNVKERMRGTR